jgi:glycosyltransferase involved in cell wall biosynthesis
MDTAIGNKSYNEILVSVILPVYNAELYLEEAIRSVLNQTFTNFELLIYNDASTDKSDSIIKSIVDKRICYENGIKNEGLVTLLNKGLKVAKGKYIARMDADDICMPTRFEEQVEFLEKNTEVGICGSWYNDFGTIFGLVKRPVLKDEIESSLFYGTPVGHPTVMMRKEMLLQNKLMYNNDFLYAEDYDLFERASSFFEIANLPTVLFHYRKHDTQITNVQWQYQYFLAGKIQARRFSKALKSCTDKDVTWLNNFFTATSNLNDSWFEEVTKYKERILNENIIYPPAILLNATNDLFQSLKEKNIYSFYFKKYYASNNYSIGLLKSFVKESPKPYHYLGKKLTLFFILKCLVGYKKSNKI